jgi:hypothetical protein
MWDADNLPLAKTVSILIILPVTSIFFPIGAIFGIWCLIALNKPLVKAAFLKSDNFGELFHQELDKSKNLNKK